MLRTPFVAGSGLLFRGTVNLLNFFLLPDVQALLPVMYKRALVLYLSQHFPCITSSGQKQT